MIRSIEIQHLRGIKHAKLEDLTPLTILVGPNGSGKSTILEALLVGAHTAPGYAVGRAASRRPDLVGARWLCPKGDADKAPEISVTTSDQATRVCLIKVDPTSPHEAPRVLCEVQDSGESASKQIPVEFRAPDRWDYERWSKALGGIPEVRLREPGLSDVPLHRRFTEAKQARRLQDVAEIVQSVAPEVSSISLGAPADTPLVYFDYAEYSAPAALAGDGVYALLGLCFELGSCSGGVVLVEEPELHLHPGAIRGSSKVMLGAMRRGIQVIISTHSLELIDALLVETQDDEELNKLSVYRIRLHDGCLESVRLEGSDVAFMRSQIEDDLR